MKKLIYLFALIVSISVITLGCRDKKTADEKIEDAIEEVGDELEDASDDVKDAVEDVKDEIEEAAEEGDGDGK